MANTRLSMRKIEEVLRLHHAGGRSNREIAQAVHRCSGFFMALWELPGHKFCLKTECCRSSITFYASINSE